MLLLFGTLGEATRCVQAIAALQPSACDLMDRRVLSLGRDSDPRFESMIPVGSEAALIVEQAGMSERETRDRIARVVSAARGTAQSTRVAFEAHDFEDVEFLWSLPQRVVPLLTRLKGTTRPLPFVEDIAVPPEHLHEFLTSAHRVFQEHEVTASLYAHAAAGQLHLRPFLPSPSSDGGARLETLAASLYEGGLPDGWDDQRRARRRTLANALRQRPARSTLPRFPADQGPFRSPGTAQPRQDHL
ncbi:MAG: hypothetical protein Ct9H300mP1_28830 [Planctomycetaceae bacterium]|nr:MAG: hypothetical protein Ct9H300mP1_28830 [Planctomycetaceae bacterium]